jgi:hypothetical protein
VEQVQEFRQVLHGAREPVQPGNNHDVNITPPHHFQQSLESRTVGISAGLPIIGHDFNFGLVDAGHGANLLDLSFE